MVKQTIQVFARLKPTKAVKKGNYELSSEGSDTRIIFHVPRVAGVEAGRASANGVTRKAEIESYVNNRKETHTFRFQKVFDVQSKQEEIFDAVAKPVIDNVLKGYNGTIFAYGQTGSGKTYTITGGAERYADRGIIPRALSYIFSHYTKNCSDGEFSAQISYLEIYNESGYDLLDPRHESTKLDDLPKVALYEDSTQSIHLKNLSTHTAGNEEQALNLLFLGDTNRMIAETPMNQASTRSHCIFTVHLTSRLSGSATVRRSKLHLVDLAGSERVSKTGVNGQLLTEAKYINLSLHYLEQVIVALSERSRQHIPYRNSMMTSVLRDSLGGNCMTSMIATCAVDLNNIDETLSTCRFSQRVAIIHNEAEVNEELDPNVLITRLKREVDQLRGQLALQGQDLGQGEGSLSQAEQERGGQAVEAFLLDDDQEAVLNLGADLRLIQYCFYIMKAKILQLKKEVEQLQSHCKEKVGDDETPVTSGECNNVYKGKEARQLRGIIHQRDNEINILVNMLKKEKLKNSEKRGGARDTRAMESVASSCQSNNASSNGSRASSVSEFSLNDGQQQGSPITAGELNSKGRTRNKILGEMSHGRQEAYDVFRRDYIHTRAPHIDSQRASLKKLYTEAKQLGQSVNESREAINSLKVTIEKMRSDNDSINSARGGSSRGSGYTTQNSKAEENERRLRDELESEKKRYKEGFDRLREMKVEIEHLQHLLEKSNVQMMKEFEVWWNEQVQQQQQKQQQQQNVPLYQQHSPKKHGLQSADIYSNDQDNNERGWTRSVISQDRMPLARDRISLTGDARADDDIRAFIEAREAILRQQQQH